MKTTIELTSKQLKYLIKARNEIAEIESYIHIHARRTQEDRHHGTNKSGDFGYLDLRTIMNTLVTVENLFDELGILDEG